MRLTGQQQELDQIAKRINKRHNLGRQSAASAQWLDAGSPFYAGRLLMDLKESAVDECIFKVGIITHVFEKKLENAHFRLTSKPPELAVPTAKSRWEVAPRRPGAHSPQDLKNKRLSFAVVPDSLMLPGRRGSSHRQNMSDTTNCSLFVKTSILGV